VKRGSDWEPLDIKGIKTRSLRERKSKVEATRFASPLLPGSTFKGFCDSLPQFLAAEDFKEIVSRIVAAVRGDKMVLLGMGAHPIKVGLSPIIINLMERGVIRGLAMNGAGIVHDVEIAMAGKTSEEVAEGLSDGSFGVKGLPYRDQSICAAAFRLDIPLTVHVAIGTDVIHIHPSTDGSVLGEMTYRDFRLFASLVAALEGGVYINVGSAVIMPEVFLKALSAVRNLGHQVEDFATLNMDFIQHYRPTQNVVQRPTAKGGKGFALTGHHEIMVPLLAVAIIEGLEEKT
jgi:hypothetical protein